MTEIERIMAKFFKPHMLTKIKERALRDLAEKILSAKNEWLLYSFNEFEYFFNNNISKYDFNGYLLCNHDILLPSQVKTEAVEDVYVKLKQRKDLINKKNSLSLSTSRRQS